MFFSNIKEKIICPVNFSTTGDIKTIFSNTNCVFFIIKKYNSTIFHLLCNACFSYKNYHDHDPSLPNYIENNKVLSNKTLLFVTWFDNNNNQRKHIPKI